MAWPGYFEYAGTEIVNASRTEAYAAHDSAYWFKPIYENYALGPILGEKYTSPLQDDAPWVDPLIPDSFGFYGCYPLDVTGVEDSTMTANIVESTRDGGVVQGQRRGTKAIVMSLALVGCGECAVETGFRWLKAALSAGCGVSSNCVTGNNLCFLSCEPALDFSRDLPGRPYGDAEECLGDYLRSLHEVTVTSGPTVTGKATTASGGVVWMVSVTLTAGDPYEYGKVRPIVAGFGDPDVSNPYVGGDTPEGGWFDLDGTVQQEVDCPAPGYQPFFDPTCPLLIAPPGVPNVALACFTFPVNFRRRAFIIPATDVPMWTSVVPVLTVVSGDKEIRNLRVRYYADPLGMHDTSADPCNYCGDMVLSYIPPRSRFVVDGTEEVITVQTIGNVTRRADSTVFSTSGRPFEWPELACRIPYLVTIDLPQSAVMPSIDLELHWRVG